MYYEYIVHNHTKLIDLDNISWIDLQVNDVGMHSQSCVVYTNHGTVLTLHNEDASAFVDAYKLHKINVHEHREFLNWTQRGIHDNVQQVLNIEQGR